MDKAMAVRPLPPNKAQVPIQVPASAVAVPVTNQRDTRPNDARTHSDAHKLNGSRRGGSGPRNQGRSSPTKQAPVDNKGTLKENLAPSKDVPQVTDAKDAPATAPLTAGGNRAQPQKAGANGVTAPGGPAPSSAMKPQNQENNPPNVQVDQLRTAIDGLTFDETPAPPTTKAVDQDSLGTTDTAAGKDAPLLPAPIVVPYPGASKPAQPKNNLPPPNLPGLIEPKTEEERKEREYHHGFMNAALAMGQLALDTNETPVGCVLVYHGRIIAKGMNATNVTRNGTRHAEFMALSALFSRREGGDVEDVNNNPALDDACWGDVDPSDGHIFPYGQKLHPAPVVDRSIVSECVLYVTVEPCVMCASLLRQLGIKKVYFGAVNDKFGGTGGVFRIHLNSRPVLKGDDRPYQNGYGPADAERIAKGKITALPREEDDGDGGNVEPGYPVEGGYFRDDAVKLLRHFYVQENGRGKPARREPRPRD
ncbi:tRNA(adenine34) deaminase [Diatrype stigma]|uniref:tRNA(Adenine34) deaminase n=1 Tax=Diatrype stigma TaxID=117547 RepID=A0AAN9UWJ5_9PEZI